MTGRIAGAGRRVGVGIDVGTQGVRVVVLAPTPDGSDVVGMGAAPITGDRRADARHEQPPQAWWAALVSATRAALAQAGPVEVAGVALDATSGTVLVEAADGTATGPALLYDDGRAAAQADRAQRAGEQLWAALGYRMQPSWALPKALWLLESGALGTGDRVVHQAEHLVRRLVGHPVAADTSHALKTGADPRTVAWPHDVLDGLGLDERLLPELVLPGAVLGVVGPAAAEATGLPAGAVVRAGMTDGCAAQIAAAALRPGRWSSVLGTTLVVKGSSEQLVRDPTGAVYCHRHPDGGWLPGGASSTGAGVLRDLAGSAAGRPVDLDALTAQAAARALPRGTTYPLAGRGERFPFVSADAHGFLAAGLRDDADRFASLCLGIAYVERLAYDVLGLRGADVSGEVAATGGGARNAWWVQLRADVLGRPVRLPRAGEPATGMAVLALAEPGRLTETAERLVGGGRTLLPDAGRGERLTAGYRDLVSALAGRGWLADELARPVLALGPQVAP